MRFRLLLVTLFSAFFTFPAVSHAARNWEIDVGADAFSHGLNRTVKDASAATGFFGPFFYNLDVQIHGTITGLYSLSPRLIYTPMFFLAHQDPGSPVKTGYLIFELPVDYEYDPSFDLSAGLAYVDYMIQGPGGTTQLNNGNGTSTFAEPGNSVSAKTIGVMLGARYTYQDFHFGIDLLTEGLLSSKKREYSLMFAATYSIN